MFKLISAQSVYGGLITTRGDDTQVCGLCRQESTYEAYCTSWYCRRCALRMHRDCVNAAVPGPLHPDHVCPDCGRWG